MPTTSTITTRSKQNTKATTTIQSSQPSLRNMGDTDETANISNETLNKKLDKLLEVTVTKQHFDTEIQRIDRKVDAQAAAVKAIDTRLSKAETNITTMPDAIYKEIHEQELRKKNIIIFKLPEENENLDKKAVFQKEKNTVNNMLIDMEVIRPTEDASFRLLRLGKRSTSGDIPPKIRPLKVTFQTNAFRDHVLANCKNLKHMEEWNDVSIVADLTKTQQRLSKSMRKSLQEEAVKNNSERSSEEIENGAEWKVIGHYGNGNLRLVKQYPK